MPESFLNRFIAKPASPGRDFSGTIVACGPSGASADKEFKVGAKVFGSLNNGLAQFGTTGEYIIAEGNGIAVVPEGLNMADAATLGCAALTAYQSLPRDIVKHGSKVFINGGSGGTGSFGIQIAKAHGAHVVTSCSTANVELCKQLGADEVIDYRTQDVQKTLSAKGQVFDLVVDNVVNGSLPFVKSGEYLKPKGAFAHVGVELTFKGIGELVVHLLRPSWLGGGNRKFLPVAVNSNTKDLKALADLVVAGKVKPLVDEVFQWEDTPKAFARLRTGRTKGKIVIRVKSD